MENVKADTVDLLQIASQMASGEIDGIVPTDTCLLVPLRITGTGITERFYQDSTGAVRSYTINRKPEEFLCDSFLARCNGLPVIFTHPEDLKPLDYNNFEQYVIGTIFMPYIKGDEVWGVAKVFNLQLLDAIQNGMASTSPWVKSENVLENGEIVEKLEDINHIAIVSRGHWDNDKPAIASEIIYQDQLNLGETMEEEKKVEINDELKETKVDSCKVDGTGNVETIEPAVENIEEVKKDEGTETRDIDSRIDVLEKSVQALIGIVEKLVKVEEPEHQEDFNGDGKIEGSEKEEAEDIIDEDEERKKEEIVNTVSELADSAHSDVGFKRPSPRAGEKASEYMARVINLNKDLVDDKYKGLKVDEATYGLGLDAIHSISNTIAKKTTELNKSASNKDYAINGKGEKVYNMFGGR